MSITLHTTLGDLKIQLHCEQTPLAATNFLALAAAGKYNNVPFHRVLKSFLIQGGDTTLLGGKSGETIFATAFPCEIHPQLTHSARGVVAMATKPKEPNANLSQFYIIFSPQPHLDKQSTIFGCVIDGWEVLDAMEKVETDPKFKPLETLAIESVTIHSNPFAEQEQ